MRVFASNAVVKLETGTPSKIVVDLSRRTGLQGLRYDVLFMFRALIELSDQPPDSSANEDCQHTCWKLCQLWSHFRNLRIRLASNQTLVVCSLPTSPRPQRFQMTWTKFLHPAFVWFDPFIRHGVYFRRTLSMIRCVSSLYCSHNSARLSIDC
jgi:hypothetical protein